MKTACAVLFLGMLSACGSSAGPAPVISNLTIQSPLAAGATTASGMLEAMDSAGLTDLILDFTVTSSNGGASSFSAPVQGGSSSQTSAPLPFVVELSPGAPAGSYTVAVTLSAGGQVSNMLTTTVVLQ